MIIREQEIVNDIGEIYSKNPSNQVREVIANHFIPSEKERNSHAEISTPPNLVDEMLDQIPKEFWQTPHKVLEPCCGKGNFVIGIFDRFFQGLQQEIPDKFERCRVIMTYCLYYADISMLNVFITTEIMKCHVKCHSGEVSYPFNHWVGNTLKLDISQQWELKGFDAVIGNPPYQEKVGDHNSQPKWNLFVVRMIKILNENGYLNFVHPSGWRSPEGIFRDVFNLINERDLIFLKMNDFKQGRKMFGVGTNYDYYLLKNIHSTTNTTIINDIDNNIYSINLNGWEFIPSGKFDLFEQMISKNGERINILHDYSSYETRKKWVSKNQDNEHIYPCVYTITAKNGVNTLYSSISKCHFGVPKVIWSNGLGTYPIIDEKGDYGLTQFAYAIVDSIKNLQLIADAMNHPNFIKLMTYVKFTNNKYNHKVIALFKKDFWKYFIQP